MFKLKNIIAQCCNLIKNQVTFYSILFKMSKGHLDVPRHPGPMHMPVMHKVLSYGNPIMMWERHAKGTNPHDRKWGEQHFSAGTNSACIFMYHSTVALAASFVVVALLEVFS